MCQVTCLAILRVIYTNYNRVFFVRVMVLISKIGILVVAIEACQQFADPASHIFIKQSGFVNIHVYPKLHEYKGFTKSCKKRGFPLLAKGTEILNQPASKKR